jgi:hypothetical protein
MDRDRDRLDGGGRTRLRHCRRPRIANQALHSALELGGEIARTLHAIAILASVQLVLACPCAQDHGG